jgi:ppGpp synthetase/RelA/SpoT-type nucleotidyltranferase
MGAEDHIENLDKEGYRSLGKVLQCPVQDNIRA